MLKEIRLGENLRKKNERMDPRVRDVILAEEKRMAKEICRVFEEEGGLVVPGFFDRAGKPVLEFEPKDERVELVNSIMAECKKAGDFYLTSLEKSISCHVPLSIEIDVIRSQDKHRSVQIRFFNANNESFGEGLYDLDEYGISNPVTRNFPINAFEMIFGLHWFTIASSHQEQNTQTLKLAEKFEIVREATHIVGFDAIRIAAAKAGIISSSSLNKRLFTFVATLWPHRDNPMPKMLAHPYAGYNKQP